MVKGQGPAAPGSAPHLGALASRLRKRPGRARTQLSCATKLCSPPEVGGCSRVPEPKPCRGVRSLGAGSLGGRGTSNTVRRGSAPREVGCLNLRGAKRRGLRWLGTARAGAEEPGPLAEPGARRLPTPRSHSPSLRHSAVSTRASTTKTLASMALAGGGRTEAGRGGDAAAESESAAAGGARPAL